jgi:hypothetical protein
MEQLPLFKSERLPESDKSQASQPAPVRKVAPPIPAEVIVAAVELMGAIDLDPYCVDESTTLVPAKLRYGVDAKALASSWGPKRKRVFLAPPAGRATANWMNKLCDEYEAGNVSQGVAYLRAALDSDWWNRLIKYPICIVHRQLRVAAGSHSTTSPWAVVYLGTNLRGFAEAFAEVGALYVPYRDRTAPVDADNTEKTTVSGYQATKVQEPSSPQTIQQGDFVLTVHANARYLTLSNPYWDTQDQSRVRELVLDIPGVLPRQYSRVSKSQDGTTMLVFSFQKGQAQQVVSGIRKLLGGGPDKPVRSAKKKAKRT